MADCLRIILTRFSFGIILLGVATSVREQNVMNHLFSIVHLHLVIQIDLQLGVETCSRTREANVVVCTILLDFQEAHSDKLESVKFKATAQAGHSQNKRC